MSFTLKIKDKVEEREINGDLTIKDLLDDLDLSSETMVSKKNGEIVIEEETIEDGDEIEFIQIIYLTIFYLNFLLFFILIFLLFFILIFLLFFVLLPLFFNNFNNLN